MTSPYPIATIVGLLIVALSIASGLIWLERRILALWQDRYGPNRVGPFGLLQVVADMIKIFAKEDWIPPFADKPVFVLAPAIIVVTVLMTFAVLPIAPGIIVSDLNVGLLFFLAMSSLGVYSVVLAGWSSDSKYSLLGALRGGSQMISYELALGLALIGPIILAGTLSLRGIVEAQRHMHWFIVPEIVAFFIYLTAAFAETNRIPFDLPEAEGELGAGYHTEYSAMRFAMFFVSEYVNMITVACVATLVFFGGWSGPLFGPALVRDVLPIGYFVVKVCFFLFFYIWVRATLPRFRYDQLMAFGWKVLVPLALANIMVTSLVVALR